MKNKITGGRPEYMFGNYDISKLKLKEGEKILYDIESGLPYKVSQEYYDSYMKLLESLTPKQDGVKIGHIFITGTGGSKDNVKDIFYNPEGYKFKEDEYV